jgi:hypothetical protein
LPGAEPVAAETAHEPTVAVQLGQQLRADARLAVEVVGVLRDEEPKLAESLELGEGQVGGVGPDLSRRNPSPWRRQPRIAPRPDPVGAAEGGDAGIGADASAGEGDGVLGLDDPSGDRLDVLLGGPVLGHNIRCEAAASSGEDNVSDVLARAPSINSTLPYLATNS